MVFVFATGTVMNANSSNEEIITPTTETSEIVEDFGCARDCVDSAMDETFEDAVNNSSLPLIADYMDNYESCYAANC
ncbi:MAG: hypothetical protein V3V28_00335 [Polaribacter sp.]|uniref:hypothetical protein n=1 Tax=Polaribacter sp. TaxID=1920175 RepID=UPI002F3583AE